MAQPSTEYQDALEPFLLALADDELIMGHRHSEWTGWAPHIEEDIAFSSIAQDEIGHAALYYAILADTNGSTADHLALARQPDEYLSCLLVERPNDDWAYTLARHFLYESAERIRLDAVMNSSFKPLADAVAKISREERYHQLHADSWFTRLAHGPLEGRHQFSVALSSALPDAVGIFEPTATESKALELGIVSRSSEDLLQDWLTDVVGRIEEAGISFTLEPEEDPKDVLPTSSGEMPEQEHSSEPRPSIRWVDGRFELKGNFPGMGGRKGKHSPDFDDLWDDLTKTYREEPTATW